MTAIYYLLAQVVPQPASVENAWQAVVALATIGLVGYQIYASQQRDKANARKIDENTAATASTAAKTDVVTGMLDGHLTEYKRALDEKSNAIVNELKGQIAILEKTAVAMAEAKVTLELVQKQNQASIDDRAAIRAHQIELDAALRRLAEAKVPAHDATVVSSGAEKVAASAATKLVDVAANAATKLIDAAEMAATKLTEAGPIAVTITPAAEPLPVTIAVVKKADE